ncbi:MAG: glutamate--tRNA ligase [Phycisphaerales bacterium]|nr:glutamate--tRNA ligase [Phycisphaerales bacterium]MCB9835150.1 glutamate--tRNA ligase [Phycisphaera sp.]
MTNPITRFAPSPTGHLHIGGARTALFCAAYAHGHAGRFVLRIEDTDQKRSSEAAARGILEDLAWLGITWDDGPAFDSCGGDSRSVGPYYQSERLSFYNEAFQKLLDAGLAYPCFETTEELAEMRQSAEANKQTFIYRQRADYDHASALKRAESEEHVLRFKMPAQAVTVKDEILGEVVFPYEELDDLVIRKRDGFPTYHFAVVVDDQAMGVTHVIRGQEHLNNTPRHVALMGALGYPVPVFAHLPLIFNPDGSKMSKRDKDKAVRAAVKAAGDVTAQDAGVDEGVFAKWQKDKTVQLPQDKLVPLAERLNVELPEIEVEDFRRSGYLPEAVVNYIALLGWNPGEKVEGGKDLERFDRAYLDSKFDFGRVGKAASKFDREKLRAFNFDLIKSMEPGAFAKIWRAWAERYDKALVQRLSAEDMHMLAPAVQPRAATLSESRQPIAYLFVDAGTIEYDEKAVAKFMHKGEPAGADVLREFAPRLAEVEPFTPEAIEARLADYCEHEGLKMGSLAQPIRIALTGAAVSPPLGVTLASLGKEESLRRIERCLAALTV